MAIFDSGSFQMNYEVVPRLMPEPTLLIHGNVASNTWWRPFLEQATENPHGPHPAILAEWRGSGKSSAPQTEDELSSENLAQDYIKLLEHLNLSRVDIIGHSTGGLIAMLAMAQKPEAFRRAVLVDPVLPAGLQFGPQQLAVFERLGKDRDFCEAVMATTIEGVSLEDPLFQQIVDDAFHVSELNFLGIPRALGVDHSARLSQLHHPTLFIQGELDPILPAKAAREFCLSSQNVIYRELKGRGHSPLIEAPGEFAQMVFEFLEAGESTKKSSSVYEPPSQMK